MNKRHRKIIQSRIRAVRKALKSVANQSAPLLATNYDADRVKLINKQFVECGTYTTCKILSQRSDKWMLRAFRAIKNAKAATRFSSSYINFWVTDQRIVLHYFIHGQLKLSKHGEAFHGKDISYTLRRLEATVKRCEAGNVRNFKKVA